MGDESAVSSLLSIGTTHPRNVAGVGRDIVVSSHFGVTCFTVVAAVSSQNEQGLSALYPLEAAIVGEQLAVMPWERIDAVRIGALVTSENIAIVTHALREREIPVVVDPVLRATLGGAFYDDASYDLLRDTLLVLPTAIPTPNIAEAARLLGVAHIDDAHMLEAATTLRGRGANAVVLTGGHRAEGAHDVLVDHRGPTWFEGERIDADLSGTGCTFAAALAAGLANRRDLIDAVADAREFVRGELLRASKGYSAFVTNSGRP